MCWKSPGSAMQRPADDCAVRVEAALDCRSHTRRLHRRRRKPMSRVRVVVRIEHLARCVRHLLPAWRQARSLRPRRLQLWCWCWRSLRLWLSVRSKVHRLLKPRRPECVVLVVVPTKIVASLLDVAVSARPGFLCLEFWKPNDHQILQLFGRRRRRPSAEH